MWWIGVAGVRVVWLVCVGVEELPFSVALSFGCAHASSLVAWWWVLGPLVPPEILSCT